MVILKQREALNTCVQRLLTVILESTLYYEPYKIFHILTKVSGGT